MRDCFYAYHPLVNIAYFAAVLGCAMVLLHPVCLVIALAASLGYALLLRGRGAGRFYLRRLLPLLVVTALLSPAFNHAGGTILAYLPGGNPLTLESVAYGLAAAVMLITTLGWCVCLSEVVTSDKLVYLLGRAAPSLSLVLSMSLRLIPRLGEQARIIADAQACAGRPVSEGPLLLRLKNGVRVLSILITWTLEHAVETADSMRARGYGLPGRTAFSIYRFTRRDACVLAAICSCVAVLAAGCALGGLSWRYFPTLRGDLFSPSGAVLLLVYLILCTLPLILGGKEALTWRKLHSHI